MALLPSLIGSGNSPVGFASGEADVKLEERDGGTKLIYNVEANVGGKIAQVGSRLIDMTAKKMADIFFGKFTQIISPESITEKKEENNLINEKNEKKITVKKSLNKILIYSAIAIIFAITVYYFLV